MLYTTKTRTYKKEGRSSLSGASRGRLGTKKLKRAASKGTRKAAKVAT